MKSTVSSSRRRNEPISKVNNKYHVGALGLLLILIIVCPVMGAEMSIGTSLTGTIESPGSTDEYTFPVESGDEIFVRVHSSSDTLSSLSMEINATSGATTTSLSNYNGLELARVLHVTTSGTCSLIVGADYDQTGDYSVYLQRLNDPVGSQPLMFGTATNGSITTSADMATYTFSGIEQDVIKTWMASAENNQGGYEFLYLFRTDGVLVKQSRTWSWSSSTGESGWGSSGDITATLPSSSNYVLLAGGEGTKLKNYSFTYRLFAQRVNNPGNTVALELGRTIEDSFDSILAWKTYTFPLNAGDTIFVRLSKNSEQNSWGSLHVFGPDGAEDIGGSIERGDAQIFHITQTGTYTFIIGDFTWLTHTAVYSLYVQRLNNPVNSQGNLAFGTAQTATITTNGEMDTYTVSGSEQDVLTVWLKSDWWDNSKGNLLYLYRDDGLLVARSDIQSWYYVSGGGGWKELGYISTRLPSSANYVLLVGGGGSDWQISGTYQVNAQWANRPANATHIAFGDYVAGSISTPGEMDAYVFTAQQGDPIHFSLTTAQSVVQWLYAPDGTEMDLGWNSWQTRTPIIAPDTGTYTIFVGDDGGGQVTGDYGLYLQHLASPVNTTPIEIGHPTNGLIDLTGQVDAYSFSANAGDVLIGRAKSLQFMPWVRIYDPSGTLIGRYDDRHSAKISDFTLELTVSGTYTILLSSFSSYQFTGDYGLSIRRLGDTDNTVSLEFGQTTPGSIGTAGEIDAFIFNGTVGDRVVGRMQTAAGSGPRLQVYGPTGTFIGAYDQGSGAPEFFLDLPSTGTYTVLVLDQGGSFTGDYAVFLQRTNNPGNAATIVGGDIVNGSIDLPAEFDTFIFEASQGDLLSAQFSSQFQYPYNAALRVYAPNGTLLISNPVYYERQVAVSMVAPVTGTYVMFAGTAYSARSTGTYVLKLGQNRPIQMLHGDRYFGNVTSVFGFQPNYYWTEVPAGTDLLVQVVPDSPSAKLELYGALNRAPTPNSYDLVQKEKTINGAYELLISPTVNGTYWFGIMATEGTTGYMIRAIAATGGGYITNVYPTAVDAGSGTRLQIYGLGFVPGVQAGLAMNGTKIATARSTFLASTTMLVATFDLSAVPSGVYDIVVEWPDHTIYTLPSGLEVRSLPGGVLYQEKEFLLTGGQTTTIPLSLDHNPANLFVTLQKKDRARDATLTVQRDGVVVETDSNYQDQLIHIPNPAPGNYSVSVTAGSGDDHAVLTIWDQLPILTPGEWVVDTIHRSYGSAFHQLELPAGQETLKFDAQAMGGSSHFRIYNGQWGEGQTWISSSGPEASLTIPNPPPGLYIIEFVDSQPISGEDQAREVMLRASTSTSADPLPSYLPVISSFTPRTGGNAGMVTMTIHGAWLDPNATVSLDQNGGRVITALSSFGNQQRTSLVVTFNLTDKIPGSYNVSVTNPDNNRASALDPFIIEENGRSDFWVEVVGRETIRVGRPATYIIKYGNRGTIDMPAPYIAIAADPPSSSVSIQFPPAEGAVELDRDILLLAEGPEGSQDILPAGSSFSREVQVTTSSTAGFTLTAIPYGRSPIYSPQILESVIDAASPTQRLPHIFDRVYPAGLSSYLGPLGKGWIHSYDLRLEEMAEGHMGVMRGDAISALLLKVDDNTYVAENGCCPVLARNGDGTWVLTMQDSSTIRFGADQKPISFTDSNENQVTLTYSESRLIEIAHTNGDRFVLDYNANGRISRLTDQVGKVTMYNYNSDGTLLTSVTAPDGRATTYTYELKSSRCALASATYPGGITKSLHHDGDGRLSAASLNANKQAIQYTYDEDSKTTTVRDAEGISNTLTVNEKGLTVQRGDAAGNIFQNGYDQNDDLVVTKDPLGHTNVMSYDQNHNLIGISDALGNDISLTYNTQFNKVKSVTDPRGNTISNSFDSKGNVIQTTYPDSLSESGVYDPQGNVIRRTNRGGESINLQYNARGQITRIDYPDGSFKAYSYDASGNMLTAESPVGTISITYDSRNLPTMVRYPDGSSFAYSYDDGGHLTRRVESDGYTTNFVYDDVGNLVQITDGNGSVIVKYSYGPSGKITRKDHRSGGYTTCAYNTAGQISLLTNFDAKGATLSRFGYQYDAVGNPVSVEALEGRYQYEYDAVGQLVKVNYPDGSEERYAYDASGNRVSVTTKGTSTAYSTNAMNQYGQVGPETIMYDANGNMVSRTEGNRTTTYDYDYDNRLVMVSSPDSTLEFTYDALGNRVGVRENGTLTRYSVDPMGLGSVVAEFAENGTLKARYTHGIGLISMIDPSGTEYDYHFNPSGHTSEITDPTGQIVNKYRYTPFGDYQQKIEEIDNPFTYVGEFGVMDDGNDILYMRMRYYSPELGRFTSEDPMKVQVTALNRYSYVGNNPVLFIDPLGTSRKTTLCAMIKIAAGIGGVGAAIGAITLAGPALTIGGGIMGFLQIIAGEALFTIGIGELVRGEDIADGLGELVGERMTGSEMGANVGGLGDEALDINPKNWNFKTWRWFPKGMHPAEAILTLLNKLCDLLPDDPSPPQPVDPRNSVDPEDKYGPTGYDSPDTPRANRQRFVTGTDPLEYRVDFWNAENATANVCDVSAFDQLDSDLDLNTFGFTEVGFTNWSVPLGGSPSFDVYVDPRPSMPYIVHITGNMNPATGNVTLEYHTLDPTTLELPDDPIAGFLPPLSTNEYGWFTFSAAPKSGSASGTVIENRAYVNFDYTQYFPAPPDGPWRNTLDSGAPTTRMTATLRNSTEIHVAFTGADASGGSGMKDYTIYATDNGGGYTPVLNHVTDTSAVLTGVPGHTYQFFCVGRDNAGNAEGMKSTPEATVAVPGFTPPPTPEITTPTPIQGLIIVPGGAGLPRDLDSDGRYEDINGNGRRDFADVVLYFNQMTWIATNEPAGALDFDYNENSRIDFADVVWLFNNL